MRSNNEMRGRANPAVLIFACCACLCMTVVIALLIVVLVRVSHLESAMPVVASAATAMSANAAAAATPLAQQQQQQSPQGVRNALLRHNIAGMKHDGVTVEAKKAAPQAVEADNAPKQDESPKRAVRELSLAERIARAKQTVQRERNVQ